MNLIQVSVAREKGGGDNGSTLLGRKRMLIGFW